MLSKSLYKRLAVINLLLSTAALVVICAFLLLTGCNKDKLADECDKCEVDADCKEGLTCEQFGEWWSTIYKCAASTTEECAL